MNEQIEVLAAVGAAVYASIGTTYRLGVETPVMAAYYTKNGRETMDHSAALVHDYTLWCGGKAMVPGAEDALLDLGRQVDPALAHVLDEKWMNR